MAIIPSPGEILSPAEYERLQCLAIEEDVETKQKKKNAAGNYECAAIVARRQKLEEKNKDVIEAEIEKVKTDLDEAITQQQNRKKQLERAARMKKESCDTYKSFNSVLLHSDMIAEREKYKKLKEIADHMENEKRRIAIQLEKKKCEELLEEETLEKLQNLDKRAKLKEIRSNQLDDFKRKRAMEMEAERLEGIRLREESAKELERQQEGERKKKHEVKKALEENEYCNKYIQEVKKTLKQKELLMNEEVEWYRETGDKLRSSIKEKEIELRRKNLMVQMNMITKQANYLEELKIRKDEEERMQREEEIEKKKKIDAEMMEDMIDKHRRKQLAIKENGRQEQEEEKN